MQYSLRIIVAALVVLGAGIGVAFGAGVAYGRGDPKTVETGLTAQQIQQLLGVDGSQGGTTGSSTPGQGGGGFQGGGLFGGGNTIGEITAIDGDTITVQGAQGEVTVTLAADTTVTVQDEASAADLQVGDSVIVAGEADDDGNVQAASVSELPAALSGLGGGGTPGGGGIGEPAGTPAPAP